jgi:hypothetical protein
LAWELHCVRLQPGVFQRSKALDAMGCKGVDSVHNSARELLDAAIAKIEGPSMRDWAKRNYQAWLNYTSEVYAKNPKLEADRLCAFIVCTALEG